MLAQAAAGPDIGYGLADISLLEISMKNLADEFPEGVGFGFKLGITQRLDIGKEFAEILVDAALLRSDNEAEIAKIIVGYRFVLQNFKNIVLLEGKHLPNDLADILNNISISTTRGILFSEFRGTSLNNKFLPLISATNLASQIEKSS